MDYEEHEEEEEEAEAEAEEMDQELPSLYQHHPTNPSTTPRKNASNPAGVRYRECLKNHAVNIAGHAVDGCGEFLAAGDDGTLDALKCAACGCHRNFHRKETDGDPGAASAALYGHGPFSTYYRTPAGYVHVAAAPHLRPPPTLALPSTSGGGMAYGREEEDVSNPSSGGGPPGLPTPTGGAARKRFRTKFTQEQKEKMLALAERLGWRLQKQDDEVVQQFCAETGVKRHVLKVWMHNNKHTLGKKP